MIARSDRYPCLNNIPNSNAILSTQLNYRQLADTLPGRFNDLDEQCRRVFGLHFEYCKDLAHGVNRFFLLS